MRKGLLGEIFLPLLRQFLSLISPFHEGMKGGLLGLKEAREERVVLGIGGPAAREPPNDVVFQKGARGGYFVTLPVPGF